MSVKIVHQDEHQVAELIKQLDTASKDKRKSSVSVRKTAFDVKGSTVQQKVYSWRFQDWDYKKKDLPTYARGLFTTNTRKVPEIAIRGYDKFFNTGEVSETKWENIISKTAPPYELTLKENGCIIFVAGLDDDTLLVCSKHSTGDRPGQISHANAGEAWLEKQLAAIGKTKHDLARELRNRNATAVAELCDDEFEEHVLAYGPEKAGLYLHGLNFNVPEFATYPSTEVQEFAVKWGFRQTNFITMNDAQEVKEFLENAASTGAYDGRDVEGFVIRCKMSPSPSEIPYHDWFFKFKFEEPYLMYRQWRECTKALISGKTPRYNKHSRITEEYIHYTKQRLAADPSMAKRYTQNHGIIALRDDFLKFKNLDGAQAASLDFDDVTDVMSNIVDKVVLCPVATIGCGKTTIAYALTQLFQWGHVQNDDISGKGRPPRFAKAIVDSLKSHKVVFADRNNAQKHERKQIITDLKLDIPEVKLVCLHFVHNAEDIGAIRDTTRKRVMDRGDNHQTIHAATDESKYMKVMDGFFERFEACNPASRPDNGFDLVIKLDPTAGSRVNLETVISGLNKSFPDLLDEVPDQAELDVAIEAALAYKPGSKQRIVERGPQASKAHHKRKQRLEYVAITMPKDTIKIILDRAFSNVDKQKSRMFMQLKQTRRIQNEFHVTLMHRAGESASPELWKRYTMLYEAANEKNTDMGSCCVFLERVSSVISVLLVYILTCSQIVFDDRLMAVVARLDDPGEGKWVCANRVAHITIGTRDNSVKPKESNDLLAKWLDQGLVDGMDEIVLTDAQVVTGVVRGVLAR